MRVSACSCNWFDTRRNRLLRHFVSGILLFIGCCQLALSQGLSPLTPAKEYIRLNDQAIAIENAQVMAAEP